MGVYSKHGPDSSPRVRGFRILLSAYDQRLTRRICCPNKLRFPPEPPHCAPVRRAR